ncbi:transketolase [Labrys sp. LIt4]|uniref:transketolase n=1 Tax=Labrys sp. LIt4 TaxID=2821355 RepID=UPI001AE029EE|nr:transketolase [Labrys sp. LIt4]MBP0580498.1 transketolase [Labrys sp. LIt4]
MTAPPHALNLVEAEASGPASYPAPLAAVAPPSFEKTGDPAALAEIARQVRIKIVRTIALAGLGHVGGDLSVTDILTTLYFGVLNVDPAAPAKPDRDRFILSKGHCAAAFYSVLSLRGFFDPAAVDTFMKPLAALNGHPNRRKIPGVEANTGPLGHGLPIGVGTAVGAAITGQDWRTFVVLGDGELQEGSNWEAAMAAGHRKLANLTIIVDRNRFQQGAGTEATNTLEPLADKFRAFGWEAIDVDGHDMTALLRVLAARGTDRPRAVIAKTYKGRGVSFMEDRVEWHHKVPSAEQVEIALKELSL